MIRFPLVAAWATVMLCLCATASATVVELAAPPQKPIAHLELSLSRLCPTFIPPPSRLPQARHRAQPGAEALDAASAPAEAIAEPPPPSELEETVLQHEEEPLQADHTAVVSPTLWAAALLLAGVGLGRRIVRHR